MPQPTVQFLMLTESEFEIVNQELQTQSGVSPLKGDAWKLQGLLKNGFRVVAMTGIGARVILALEPTAATRL